MDMHASRAGSPTPLQAMSPERVNQQLGNSALGGLDAGLGASVPDKSTQFSSLAMQSKQLERKTADAALKRAMLGREEAEAETRRYREEARQLRKQLDESRDRERRVGERLETVMENYGRAKETHAHTQALWEKEIRRARKETFKAQSAIVKLQEELKAARTGAGSAEEALAREQERSKAREQEAFQARYDLVGCQEELEQARQKAKMLEQERNALRSLAPPEEGCWPSPPPPPPPPTEPCTDREGETGASTDVDAGAQLPTPGQQTCRPARVPSVALLDARSPAASQGEIEELTRLWHWEKQRADRSAELVEYLEAECHLRACSCMKKRPRAGLAAETPRKRAALDLGDGGDRIILSEKAAAVAVASPAARIRANMVPAGALTTTSHSADGMVRDSGNSCQPHHGAPPSRPQQLQREPRRSTIFVPEEGIFRTVSQQMHEEEMEAGAVAVSAPAGGADVTHGRGAVPDGDTRADAGVAEEATTPPGDATRRAEGTEQAMYARTPSVEPPSFALVAQSRTSLLSLLDAPHRNDDAEMPLAFSVPTMPGRPAPAAATAEIGGAAAGGASGQRDWNACVDADMGRPREEDEPAFCGGRGEEPAEDDATPQAPRQRRDETPCEPATARAAGPQRHGSRQLHAAPAAARSYECGMETTRTTTTKVPLREETADPSLAQRILAAQRTPTHRRQPPRSSQAVTDSDGPSFDVHNPALTPTMTREQCLAQIQERRGRARSAASGSSSSSSSSSASASDSASALASLSSSAAAAACTPRRPVTPGKERRDVSAPVGRAASARRVRS